MAPGAYASVAGGVPIKIYLHRQTAQPMGLVSLSNGDVHQALVQLYHLLYHITCGSLQFEA